MTVLHSKVFRFAALYILFFILAIFILSISELLLSTFFVLLLGGSTFNPLIYFLTTIPQLLLSILLLGGFTIGSGGIAFIYLIPLIVGLILSLLVIRSKSFSKVLLVVLLIISFIVGVLNFWVASIPCEGLGCIGISVMRLVANAVWAVTFASTPVLLSNIVNLNVKRYLILTASMILVLSIVWLISSISFAKHFVEQAPIKRAGIEQYKQMEKEREQMAEKILAEINEFHENPSFIVFEPTYLSPQIGKLGEEKFVDYLGQGDAYCYPFCGSNKTLEWDYDFYDKGATNYSYRIGRFVITQSSVEGLKYSIEKIPGFVNYTFPITEFINLTNGTALYLSGLVRNIRHYSASSLAYYGEYFNSSPDKRIIFERLGTRVEMYLFPSEGEHYPPPYSYQDELVKMAESVKVKYQ